jgi:large subunit ribosomal protein L18
MTATQRVQQRDRRRIRARFAVSRSERPLLVVYRSSKHLYAQIADPATGRTVTGASTRSPDVRDGLKSTKDLAAARKLGAAIAARALAREIREVTFHRNGFLYTGRIKALADAAREAGLRF